MNNRELFKEAIADAKAVKEAAIANAKAALEEAFTPFLREKLTQKLSEMEETDETVYDYDEDDAKPYLDEEGVDEYHANPDVATGYKKPGNISGEEDYTDPEDVNGIDELNLDELLAELELEEEESTKDETELNEAKEEEEETEEEEYEDVDADGIEDEDDEEVDITDVASLKKIIEDEIEKLIASGELQAGPEYDGGEEDEMEMGDEMEMSDKMKIGDEEEIDEDFSIDELLSELKKKSKKEVKKVEVKKEDETEKTEKAKKELDEAIKVVKALRGELQEMKLFNAKLLYTNKIFKARSLNESQKVKVLSTFDKAGTIKEVELVYETLSSSFSTAKKQVVKESLGFASKPTGVSQKQAIVEEDAMVTRFKKLAGLI